MTTEDEMAMAWTSAEGPTPWGADKIRSTGVLACMAEEVYACNQQNGWFDDERRFAEDIALLHSEASEMLEAFRDGLLETAYEHISTTNGSKFLSDQPEIEGVLGKPVGIGSEAADVLVRLLDTCKRHDIDLFEEFRRKLDFNWTRGHKHGGKAI